MCLTYLRDAGSSLFVDLIYYCFIISRIAVSCFAVIACVRTLRIDDDIWFLAFVVSMAIVSSLGGSWAFTIAQCFTYVGLLATLRMLFLKDFEAALIALIVLFSIYAVGNLLSVYVMHGIIKGEGPASTIYFFGGKNSVFMHGIPLLLSISAYGVVRRGRVYCIAAFIGFVYAATALYIDSLSSFVCFFVLSCCILLVRMDSRVLRLFKANYLFVLLALVFSITVIVQQTDLISVVSEALGRPQNRSGSLSGRTEIWAQALGNIASSPFVGFPEGTEYVMSSGSVADHAHSFFLNLAARYGLVCLGFFLLDVVALSWRARHRWCSVDVGLMVLYYFALLAHSLFDTMDLYGYVLIRVLLQKFIDAPESSMQASSPRTAPIRCGNRCS